MNVLGGAECHRTVAVVCGGNLICGAINERRQVVQRVYLGDVVAVVDGVELDRSFKGPVISCRP
jgi:hypothetical protein